MTTANDLIVVFLALEVLSIPLYVLAAFDRRRTSSQEAGIKYFLLGAFSSAVFLYGIALTYGATGTTSLTGHRQLPRAEHALRPGHAARRARAAPRRPRLQGRRRAVPHVDARRVPGRAHAGHRVHVVGHQGRGLRRAAARVRRRVPAVPHRLAPGDLGARRAVAHRRERRRGHPDRRESASSRTHRSRTPATSSSGSRPTPRAGARPRSSTCSCTRS